MKNEKLDKIDIINDIPIKSKRKECEDIGDKKFWKRNCPNCEKELVYKNKSIFYNANHTNSVCRWCSAQYKSYSNEYIRKCPSCKKDIIYRDKLAFDIANKKNNLCVKCYRLLVYDKIQCERTCPQCKEIIKYKNKRSYLNSKNNNLSCKSCCQMGNSHPHTKKHKKYMSKIMTGRKMSDEWKLKIKKNHWSTNPKLRKQITETHSQWISNQILNGKYNFKNKRFKTGYYINKTNRTKEYYRSSYELRRMKELDNTPNIKRWTTKHGIRIPYCIKNVRHFYIPDFFIETADNIKFIEEVKGYIENKKIFHAKTKAAISYCKKNGYKYKISYDNDIKYKD